MLRGPDPEAFRTKVYGARWYVDPLPSCDIALATKDKWPSVSTIKKAWSKPFRKKLPTGETVPLDALWAAEFIADNLPAVNLLANDRAAVVQLCALAPGRRLNAAADRGTGVHSLLEDIAGGVVAGDSLLPAEVEPFAPACRQFIEDWNPTWVASEFLCFNREVGYGGTADSIFAIRLDGQSYVAMVDYKTRSGAHGAYEEEIAQIGGYSLAEYIVVRSPIDGLPIRMELPPLDGGLVVSISADSYQLYPVELDEARRAFMGMHASWTTHRLGQKAARKARQHPLLVPPSELGELLEKSVLAVGGVISKDQAPAISETPDCVTPDPTPIDVAGDINIVNITPGDTAAEPTPSGGSGETPDQAAPGTDAAQGEPTDGLGAADLFTQRHAWLKDRVATIVAAGDEPAHALAREWSAHDHIPTFRNGGPRDVEELEAVIASCWTVEGQFQLSFPDEEPGVAVVQRELEKQGMA